jgi:uncharacterized membrane protein YkgB
MEEAKGWFSRLDALLVSGMHDRSVTILRISLGVVFLWFGALKVFGVSPVADLVRTAYWFFPAGPFLTLLGVWEMVIGLGLLFKIALRATLALLWLQMFGVFFSLVLAPGIFVDVKNVLVLTMEGEFLVKNLVLIAASLVLGGFEVKRTAE